MTEQLDLVSGLLSESLAETRQCPDPECGGIAEPDTDGDHRYWSCLDCGYDFGYLRLDPTVIAEDADGNCSIGVPAEIRRAASRPMERAMAESQPASPPPRPVPVPLGLTIGRRPSD